MSDASNGGEVSGTPSVRCNHGERGATCPVCESVIRSERAESFDLSLMPDKRYATIVADPPWPYDAPGGELTSSAAHRPNSHSRRHSPDSRSRYGAMSIAELCALCPPADETAHLYLWTTNAFMVEAHNVARAWGFTPKTICTWGKVKPDGSPSMKTGHYFRGATEHVVFAVRGKLPFPIDRPTPTLWLWPRLGHSQKPEAFYDLVEMVSPGPYLEMFARRARFGWDYWGNESLATAVVA